MAGRTNAGRCIMSKLVAGIVSIVALSATFGAIQLAAGRDLVTTGTAHSAASATVLDSVNRGAKSDRAPVSAVSGPSQTIMVEPDGLTSTSVLIRVPTQPREEARNRSSS